MTSARIVKAQIEKTTLGEIVHYIKEVHSIHESYVSIKLDMDTIQKLHLNINAYTVKQSILHNQGTASRPPVLRSLKEKNIAVNSKGNKLKILAPEMKESTGKGISTIKKLYFVIQALKFALPGVIVQGLPSVSRAVINEEVNDQGIKNYYLLVEGYGMQDVMGCPGVDGRLTII